MYKNYIFLLIIILLSSSKSSAQFSRFKTNPYSNTLLLTLGGGLNYSETDFPNSKFGLNGLGMAEYYFKTDSKLFLGLKLETNLSVIRGEGRLNSSLDNFEINVITVGPGLTLNYQLSKSVYPYIGLEVKNAWFDNNTGINIVGDLGIRLLLSQYFAVNSNIGFNFANEDNLDGLFIKGTGNDYFTTFSIGVSYAVDFTVTDDLDGDGIKNEIDNCPEQAEDFDGFEDEDGCPEFDNDKDGIIDIEDNCVNEAEDFDGFEDYDGCPDLDNDGDGILDSVDKCPDTKEDFDGFKDQDGCPELDNDGDGILDNVDKCPNEPETFNNFKDADGCPDELPETSFIEDPEKIENSKENAKISKDIIRVSIPNEFLLEGKKTFRTGSSIIKSGAYSSLNLIVKKMKSNPGFRWRIEGHLDNAGTPFERKALSTARANAIMNYFVVKGIPSNTFQVVGLGDQYPIVPNTTLKRQMKNRRVVIKRIR